MINKPPPHIIKYMGAKSSIIDYITENIESINFNNYVYDIFAGTSIVSANLNRKFNVVINDIQEYSSILGKAYLNKIDELSFNSAKFIDDCEIYVNYFKSKYNLNYKYKSDISLSEFLSIEIKEKNLLNFKFDKDDYYLFVKGYSGTFWSFEQCLWIDSIYREAQKYLKTSLYELILASLMYAMSYSTQSTGHFAQYRDVKDQENMKDILKYRLKNVSQLFTNKMSQLLEYDRTQKFTFEVHNLGFDDILNQLQENSLVYADPPYASVHYSRFYHAFETIVKYDYPKTLFKGRYRTDRHQSPFSITTKAKGAFEKMFKMIKDRKCHLVLSYSDGGVVSVDDLMQIARRCFTQEYDVILKEKDYLHSRMGRKGEKSISVKEILIIATFKN